MHTVHNQRDVHQLWSICQQGNGYDRLQVSPYFQWETNKEAKYMCRARHWGHMIPGGGHQNLVTTNTSSRFDLSPCSDFVLKIMRLYHWVKCELSSVTETRKQTTERKSILWGVFHWSFTNHKLETQLNALAFPNNLQLNCTWIYFDLSTQ